MNEANEFKQYNYLFCTFGFLFILIFFGVVRIYAKKKMIKENPQEKVRVMFYNVENLFDTVNDPFKKDEEYTPLGDKHWTGWKYKKKLNSIYKVIVASGSWDPPGIIGLCEIENKQVLDDLIQRTPLGKYNYEYVHKDSPDARGIDVALLYKPEIVELIKSIFIKINFPEDEKKQTRDILYVKGVIQKCDTIHLYVNHWPSRRGGLLASESSRVRVAQVLKSNIDSIFAKNIHAKILVMGDFNDEPENISLTDGLCAKKVNANIVKGQLYNLSFHKKIGTYKYQSRWYLFDQFIISGSLLNKRGPLFLYKDSFHIMDNDFLLKDDKPGTGSKPFRTHAGYKYLGGYSDHLPVFVDICLE